MSNIPESSVNKMHNPDLISALPDSLLLHILSFLNMEDVMGTSLVSRKWRYLWRSIPCLCFQLRATYYRRIELTNFIDRCLFSHEGSKVYKLHIVFDYKDIHAPLADSWIDFAMKCKVEDFKLDLLSGFGDSIKYGELNYKLPHSLYMCTTLTSLTLCGCNLNLPDSFQLGSLKKLSLELVELYSDSIEHLSSSCPVLEDIYLTDCNRDNDLNIVITNEHVKRLVISQFGVYGFGSVKINAPTLLSLGIYECYPSTRFHVEELGSLICADIISELVLTSFYDNRNYVEELLYDLRHVKHLKLCSQCLQVLSTKKRLSSDIFSISTTCLELKASLGKWELPGISFLLESCFNLEKLKIVNENYYEEMELSDEFIFQHDFEEEQYWELFETDMPSSIMQNIKTIVIDFGGKIRHEEEFIRFLLKNANNLERMVINTPKKYAASFELLLFKLIQRLTVFPISSPNAELFITIYIRQLLL